MNSNFYIQINGQLNLDCTAGDSIDQITAKFSEAKGKEEKIKSQLETFKKSNHKEQFIEGMLFVKIEMIEQVMSESEKVDENLDINKNDFKLKKEKERLTKEELIEAMKKNKDYPPHKHVSYNKQSHSYKR